MDHINRLPCSLASGWVQAKGDLAGGERDGDCEVRVFSPQVPPHKLIVDGSALDPRPRVLGGDPLQILTLNAPSSFSASAQALQAPRSCTILTPSHRSFTKLSPCYWV